MLRVDDELRSNCPAPPLDGSDGNLRACLTIIDAPPNYLAKLLKVLARAGLVTSKKGLAGGFRLARPAGEISLRDASEPIESLDRLRSWFLNRPSGVPGGASAVHWRWGAVRDAYLEFLEQTSIADLIHDELLHPHPLISLRQQGPEDKKESTP